MKIFLFLYFAAFNFSIDAISQTLNLGEMLAAPNITQFKFKLKEMRHLEIVRAQCRIQLKYEMLPISCFEVIQVEKAKHILSDGQFQKTKRWLTENCIESVSQTLHLPKEGLRYLPADCREIVMKKMNDREYRDVTMNPDSLFQSRL